MIFYVVDEDVSASDRVVVGYFHHHYDAWQAFQKSKDRRLIRFELVDEVEYKPTTIWEHPDEDEEAE